MRSCRRRTLSIAPGRAMAGRIAESLNGRLRDELLWLESAVTLAEAKCLGGSWSSTQPTRAAPRRKSVCRSRRTCGFATLLARSCEMPRFVKMGGEGFEPP